MKYKLLIILSAILPVLGCETEEDEFVFSDPEFRSCIEKITNGDDSIIPQLQSLYCDNSGITSIDGLEQLSSLQYLKLNKNQLETIDLSQNTQLKSIWLVDNHINEITLGDATNIQSIAIAGNPLSPTAEQYLQSLEPLPIIDLYTPNDPIDEIVFPDKALAHCIRSEIAFLLGTGSSIDELGFLGCSYANITDITGLDELTNLTALHLRANYITQINLDNNTNLDIVDLADNPLNSQTIEYLSDIDWIDSIQFDTENHFVFADNNLRTCIGNSTSWSLELAKDLAFLYCDDQEINSLEGIEKLENLIYAKFNGNNIEEIALPENSSIEHLWLVNNPLTKLTLPTSHNLISLALDGTPLAEDIEFDLTEIIVDTHSPNDPIQEVMFNDRNFAHCVRVERIVYGEPAIPLDQLAFLGCTNSNIQDTSGIESLTGLEQLFLHNNNITNINLEGNSALGAVVLSKNPLDSSTKEYLDSLSWIDNIVYDKENE